MPPRIDIFARRVQKAVLAAFLGVLVALPAFAASSGPDLGLGYATAIGLTTADIAADTPAEPPPPAAGELTASQGEGA